MYRSSLKTHRVRQGFTLIEMLVVIGIIAVLMAIILPAVFRAQESSNRANCMNNLRQIGIAFVNHSEQLGYYPTAGAGDWAAPTYTSQTAGGSGSGGGSSYTEYNPIGGFRQDAGWGYQILPYLDAEPIWNGTTPTSVLGGSYTGAAQNMAYSISEPLKFFFCPSRRAPTTNPAYENAKFPMESAYSAYHNTSFVVALNDYAACNGSMPVGSASNYPKVPGNGAVQSQVNGRATVAPTDVRDGTSFTLLVAEKAANPKLGLIVNEDDLGYFSGYGTPKVGTTAATIGVNFNTIRFTSANLMPIRDVELTATDSNGNLLPTGGAFGSIHANAFNALMCDGSVSGISYEIAPAVYAALGTIAGNEMINSGDLAY
ncbi:MAG TPA: DUF1559 domain-containing protein [Gemmataceae bacterium]|nr:DUF1559 domain-containing protein [Gemmataceae bacterium]